MIGEDKYARAARAAIELDRAFHDIIDGGGITEADVFAFSPVRRHVGRAVDAYDTMALEVQQFGEYRPEGRSALRLVSDSVPDDVPSALREAA